jgi:hypothetical protein
MGTYRVVMRQVHFFQQLVEAGSAQEAREKGEALLRDEDQSYWEAIDGGEDQIEEVSDLEAEEAGEIPQLGTTIVRCQFCHQKVPLQTAHLHGGEWVGDECCWTEQLRGSE